MTEYIYGDVLFVINFSMDFIALFICGKIMHFRMNFWRMALAATLTLQDAREPVNAAARETWPESLPPLPKKEKAR